MKIFIFAIYLGLDQDDLVEIKVKAKNLNEATTKVKIILHTFINTEVTGLFLNDEYDA